MTLSKRSAIAMETLSNSGLNFSVPLNDVKEYLYSEIFLWSHLCSLKQLKIAVSSLSKMLNYYATKYCNILFKYQVKNFSGYRR